MTTLLDRVPIPKGDVMVMTKTKFLLFFNRPRISVMPYGVSDVRKRVGFQVVYNTSEADVLAELHDFWVTMIAGGGFDAYCAASKMGMIDFPPEREHLRKYVIGFRG